MAGLGSVGVVGWFGWWVGCLGGWGGVVGWAGGVVGCGVVAVVGWFGLDADGQGNSCTMSWQDPVRQGQINHCSGAIYGWVVYTRTFV